MYGRATTSTPHEQPLDPGILEKAERLLATPLFVGTTDNYRLGEKQMIFLVLAGLKPVSEAASGHWVEVPGGRETVADDPDQVGAFLHSLGLAYQLSPLGTHATKALVSLRPDLLTEAERAVAINDTARYGELFGFPKTAADAFVRGDILPEQQQDDLLNKAGITDSYFCLSAKHYAEEIQVLRQWQDALVQYGLTDD